MGGLISIEGWKEIGLSSLLFPLRFHVVHRRPGWAAAGSDREKKGSLLFQIEYFFRVPRSYGAPNKYENDTKMVILT